MHCISLHGIYTCIGMLVYVVFIVLLAPASIVADMHNLLYYSLNILLDGHFTAKLGDFGFAIQMPQHIAGKTVVTALALAHSDGYGPPELLSRRYSPKSDVYAYGVVR